MIKLLKSLFSFQTRLFLLLVALGVCTFYLPQPKIMLLGGGSGAFIANEGYFVTNRHVAIEATDPNRFLMIHVPVKEHAIRHYVYSKQLDYIQGIFQRQPNSSLFMVLLPAKIVRLSEDRDVAVLKVNRNVACLDIDRTELTLSPGTHMVALILDMFRGTDFFGTAKWVEAPTQVDKIELDYFSPILPQIHYPFVAIGPQLSRPGNSGSVVIDPVTKKILGLVWGGGVMAIGPYMVFTESLYLQAADIVKTITETTLPIACVNPEQKEPLKTVGQVLLFELVK